MAPFFRAYIYIMNKRDLVASLVLCVGADGSTLVPVGAAGCRRRAATSRGGRAALGGLLLGGGQVGPRQVVGHQRVLALALAARGGRLHLGAVVCRRLSRQLHLHVCSSSSQAIARDLLRRVVLLALHARLVRPHTHA